jgi:hypothetical protein
MRAEGTWRWELRAVVRDARTRGAAIIIVENTAGVLQKAWLRAEFENALRDEDPTFGWEMLHLRPELQEDAVTLRARAYYVGVALRQATEAAHARLAPAGVRRRRRGR